MYIFISLLLLTSNNITAGYIMPQDSYNLKRQALDLLDPDSLLEASGLPVNESNKLTREFYEGLPAPMSTDVTNSAEGPSYEDIAPFQSMYDREFKEGDALFEAADNWSTWQRNQNDQGPGTKQYKEDDPIEQARLFGKLLQGQLKKNDEQ